MDEAELGYFVYMDETEKKEQSQDDEDEGWDPGNLSRFSEGNVMNKTIISVNDNFINDNMKNACTMQV